MLTIHDHGTVYFSSGMVDLHTSIELASTFLPRCFILLVEYDPDDVMRLATMPLTL